MARRFIGSVAFHTGQAAFFGLAGLLSRALVIGLLTMRPAFAQTRAA